jgi:hypothetical protein
MRRARHEARLVGERRQQIGPGEPMLHDQRRADADKRDGVTLQRARQRLHPRKAPRREGQQAQNGAKTDVIEQDLVENRPPHDGLMHNHRVERAAEPEHDRQSQDEDDAPFGARIGGAVGAPAHQVENDGQQRQRQREARRQRHGFLMRRAGPCAVKRQHPPRRPQIGPDESVQDFQKREADEEQRCDGFDNAAGAVAARRQSKTGRRESQRRRAIGDRQPIGERRRAEIVEHGAPRRARQRGCGESGGETAQQRNGAQPRDQRQPEARNREANDEPRLAQTESDGEAKRDGAPRPHRRPSRSTARDRRRPPRGVARCGREFRRRAPSPASARRREAQIRSSVRAR